MYIYIQSLTRSSEFCVKCLQINFSEVSPIISALLLFLQLIKHSC